MTISVSSIHDAVFDTARRAASTDRAGDTSAQLESFRQVLAKATAGEQKPGVKQQADKEAEGKAEPKDDAKLRETFYQFVGQTFFGQLLSSMRKSVGKPAYFHGGRGEEIFQSQMDQVLVERITDSTAESFAKPMYELFMARRR